MSDDLARFPTPQEAFGPRRTSANASPHNASMPHNQHLPKTRAYPPPNHGATYPPPNQPRKSSNPAQLPGSYRQSPVNRTASPSTSTSSASVNMGHGGMGPGASNLPPSNLPPPNMASNPINYDLEARTANLRLNTAPNQSAEYYSKFSVPRRPLNHAESGRSSPSTTSAPIPAENLVNRQEASINKPRAAADLRSLFDEVDRHKRGYLTERELSKALVNGDYTLFDAHTVRLMMKMFDRDGDGAIYFAEFGQLWRYLHDWRQVFERFDTSDDDSISLDEFIRALAAFGYNLSSTCLLFLFNAGSKLNRQGQREMSFDMFVQSCISIKSITDTFKKYDTDRDGYITMGFEDFLMETTKLH